MGFEIQESHQRMRLSETRESHPRQLRQWVDGSDPTYIRARYQFLNPTNGKLVDCSDPASETRRGRAHTKET